MGQRNSELQDSAKPQNTINFFTQEVNVLIPKAESKPKTRMNKLWRMDYEKSIAV